MNDQWHTRQETRHVVLQESSVILPCKPEKIITTNSGPDAAINDVLEELYMDFNLLTDADCVNSGFHLL
jgi:hypothetical protein